MKLEPSFTMINMYTQPLFSIRSCCTFPYQSMLPLLWCKVPITAETFHFLHIRILFLALLKSFLKLVSMYKNWLHFSCCTTHPWANLYPIVCASHTPPTGNHLCVLYTCESTFFGGGGFILKILLWISNSFSLSVLCANHLTPNSSSAINLLFPQNLQTHPCLSWKHNSGSLLTGVLSSGPVALDALTFVIPSFARPTSSSFLTWLRNSSPQSFFFGCAGSSLLHLDSL